jgi:hypothetical protein
MCFYLRLLISFMFYTLLDIQLFFVSVTGAKKYCYSKTKTINKKTKQKQKQKNKNTPKYRNNRYGNASCNNENHWHAVPTKIILLTLTEQLSSPSFIKVKPIISFAVDFQFKCVLIVCHYVFLSSSVDFLYVLRTLRYSTFVINSCV